MEQPRAYQSGDDLKRVQSALMRWTQQVGDCNYLHKGDIGHRLFNMGRRYTPEEILYYWLDDKGEVRAFVLLYPWYPLYDLQVAPDYLYTEFHRQAIDWTEQAMVDFAHRYDIKMSQFLTGSYGCDPRFDEMLLALGYVYDSNTLNMTEHDYSNIPDATLPDGFYLHDATVDDLERLADVHNNSFTSKWDVELYGRVFNAPHMEYEIVVVAPDGRFAAFTNVWVDAINHSILFEPVGTHADFRRRGIARAMMVYVLKRMQAEHGTQRAFVCHELPDKNPASGQLYASVGFRLRYPIHDYVKVVSE